MKFCINCGNQLPPERKFCTKCGMPINVNEQGKSTSSVTKESSPYKVLTPHSSKLESTISIEKENNSSTSSDGKDEMKHNKGATLTPLSKEKITVESNEQSIKKLNS